MRSRLIPVFALVAFLLASIADAQAPSSATFSVDAAARGKTIGNKVSTVNLWQLQTWNPDGKDEGANLGEFVESVQFMTATGGNASRDLFRDPKNVDVLDDYDFQPLVDKCRLVLQLGAKPTIKLSVPDKFSKETAPCVFGVDALPPDDYDVYYNYIRAMAKTLVDEFGRDEVRTWRFGVLVEFENVDWFHDAEKTPDGSRDAYFKLYDHSVAALEAELGPDVFVGAHAMACTEGLWDERLLLDHCAKERNAKTGEIGTTIKYFAVSFYDDAPNRPHPLTLAQTVARIRERALDVGLTDLRYGVDEGRILGATKGKSATDLTYRIVGQTYQAAFDARLFKIMVDNDIDYFSAWSYSTSSPWSGYPLIAYRCAQNVAKFKDAKLCETSAEKKLADGVDCDCVAAFDENSETLRVVVYNFKYDLNYAESADVAINVVAPFWKDRDLTVVETTLDDQENFFCDWLKDKERLQIPDDAFNWSPDGGAFDVGITDPEIAKIYREQLRAKYLEKANRPPRAATSTLRPDDRGSFQLKTTLARHAVVFYEIKSAQK